MASYDDRSGRTDLDDNRSGGTDLDDERSGRTDLDDLATLVGDRRALVRDDAPPALPFALKHRTVNELAWLASLPEPTRATLERAREPVADWPRVERPLGAIARPLHKIPSLRPTR